MQSNTNPPRWRAGQGWLRAGAATIVLVAACVGVAPGSVPAGFADEVDAARRSLETNWDGPPPMTFTFAGLRCRADGGLLVLFHQQGFGRNGLAFAMQGPGALPAAWAGGFAPVDPATDPEIVHFFAESPEVSCR